jgi:hypothetical protein
LLISYLLFSCNHVGVIPFIIIVIIVITGLQSFAFIRIRKIVVVVAYMVSVRFCSTIFPVNIVSCALGNLRPTNFVFLWAAEGFLDTPELSAELLFNVLSTEALCSILYES